MARYALVVGIAQYDNFRNLDKAATDAVAIVRLLQVHGQYQVEPLPKRLVAAENRWELATDKKLTGKDLGQTLETFLLEQANGHEALLYFAGHGFEVPGLGSKKKGYLATSDCTSDGRNAILFSDLNDLIRESSLSSLVVILDCCHAGSFLERTLLESTLTAFKEKKDYYLITACRSFERSREGEEHGVFTASVLKGLQAENADSEGAVTGDRLFDFVQRELRQSGQEPIRSGTGRSITLVTYQPQVKTVTAIVDEHGEVICPYQGLQVFTAKQREFFFGRKRIVEAVKQKLEQQPFVPVIGASGSGKSSVVRAGLMPWLEESGWHILEPIKPGFEPLAVLRAVFEPFFKRSRSEIQTLHRLIANDSTGLSSVIERLPGANRYLLVVDQFEEVFTVCAAEIERQRFIDLITQVTEMRDSRLAVVTTMRADFLEPCLRYPSLHHLIQSQAVFMPPLTGVDLRDVITEPAKRQGYTIEEALLLKILDDVAKELGFLPLLEFVLTKLWDKRDCGYRLLTLKQYVKLGGLTGALDIHAERVYHYRDYGAESPYDERNIQEQEWIKQIFLQLIRTGGGEKDARQRQPKAKLLAISGDTSEQQEALRELLDGECGLISGRLLVIGEDMHEANWVDLAHEALISGWQTFVEWRSKNRDLRRLSDRLEDALREWRKYPSNHNLMMGGLLAQVIENWQDLEPNLDAASKEFYRQSYVHEKDQVTRLERLRTEVEQRKMEVEKAEEKSRRKSELLANTSHQLRPTLNGMISFLKLVLEGMTDDPEELIEFIGEAYRSALHLLNIINDILDIAKIEAGKLQIELSPVKLAELLNDVADFISNQVRQKNLSFEIQKLPTDDEIILYGNYQRLLQVMLNLVGNAIKFTHDGGVTISIEIIKKKLTVQGVDLPGHVKIRVADTGIGVSLDKQDRLFQSFSQIDGSHTRQYGGLGLGLPISQKLIEGMGGILSFYSMGEGLGSTASFTVGIYQVPIFSNY